MPSKRRYWTRKIRRLIMSTPHLRDLAMSVGLGEEAKEDYGIIYDWIEECVRLNRGQPVERWKTPDGKIINVVRPRAEQIARFKDMWRKACGNG